MLFSNQYSPEIKSSYQKQCRRKPKPIARGIVAKELGKILASPQFECGTRAVSGCAA